MPTPNERLQQARRQAGFSSASEAARQFRWNENTYRSHENGERGLRLLSAERYGRAFKTSSAWLLTGDADAKRPTWEIINSDLTDGNIVKVRNGKGDREPPIEVDLPFALPRRPSMVTFVLSLENYPKYELGSLIIAWQDQEEDLRDDLLLKEHSAFDAIADNEEGAFLVRIAKQEDGLYTLFHRDRPAVAGKKFNNIYPVRAIVMPNAWTFRFAEIYAHERKQRAQK